MILVFMTVCDEKNAYLSIKMKCEGERDKRERERERERELQLTCKGWTDPHDLCKRKRERTNSVTCTYMYYVVTYWPDVYMV